MTNILPIVKGSKGQMYLKNCLMILLMFMSSVYQTAFTLTSWWSAHLIHFSPFVKVMYLLCTSNNRKSEMYNLKNLFVQLNWTITQYFSHSHWGFFVKQYAETACTCTAHTVYWDKRDFASLQKIQYISGLTQPNEMK